MNGIANKFLLTGEKFMLILHLGEPGSTSNGCGPFTKIAIAFKNSKK